MRHADIKNLRKRNNGRNGTARSGKYQLAWRKRKLQEFGDIGSGHNKTNRNERKSKNVTLCRWSAKQMIPLSVLARNQTKGLESRSPRDRK